MNRSSKHICVVRQGYFPADPRVRKQVMALGERGHAVDVICMRGPGDALTDNWNGARVVRIPIAHRRNGVIGYLLEYALFFLGAFLAVTVRDVRNRYDVVQVNTMPDTLVFAAMVAKLRGAVVVLDVHELMPELFADLFTGRQERIARRVLSWAERAAVRFADRVVAANPVQAPILEARTASGRVTLVHNVPDERTFGSISGRRESAEPPLIVTHGTLVERYGVQVLLRALPLVLQERPVRLAVIGGGAQLPELRRITNALDLEGVVDFAGLVPYGQVVEYLTRATIGVVPVIGYMETCTPNKLFEYIALQVPVVASDTPGMRAVFSDEEVEYCTPGDPVALADGINALLASPARRRSMVSKASLTYESVRWNKHQDVYARLVEHAQRRTTKAAE